jgi:single-strand DNA-binding protein
MANFNKVMLMGNLSREVEIKYTPKGTAVADTGLACNRIRMGDDGQKIEEVTYVDVTFWGRQAELAHQYLAKGKPVFIEGRLHMDSWTDKETGKQRTKLKVVAENMQFVGGPPSGGNAGGGNNRAAQQPGSSAPSQQYSSPQGGSAASEMPDFQDDDDIPF